MANVASSVHYGASRTVVAAQAGRQLNQAVVAALETLAEVLSYRVHFDEQTGNTLESSVADVQRRLTRNELVVAIIGEFKAGKSTFINALLGAPVLGAGKREFTGTVTWIRSSGEMDYVASIRSGRTRRFRDLCPDESARYHADIKAIRRALDGAKIEVNAATKTVEATRTRLVAAADSCRRAQEELARVASMMADRQALVQRRSTALAESEAALASAQAQLSSLPWAFRKELRWYAFWVWLARIFLSLFYRGVASEWRRVTEAIARAASRLNDERANLAFAQRSLSEHAEAEGRLRACAQQQRALELEVANSENGLKVASQQVSGCLARLRDAEKGLEAYLAGRRREFANHISRLTDMNQGSQEVVELQISFPARHLPQGIALLDTPGVNSTTESNATRAYEAIERDADGCVVLSPLRQVASQSTLAFVEHTRTWVPHLILVLTQKDVAEKSAAMASFDVDDNPQGQVREVIQKAKREFAQKTGRKASDILEIVVSAQAALDATDPVAAAEFRSEIEKLFAVLRAERELIIAARCTVTLRRAMEGISEKLEAAEGEFRKQIALLEEQRIPRPEEFKAAQLKRCTSAIQAAAAAILAAAKACVATYFRDAIALDSAEIRSCVDKDAVKAKMEAIKAVIPERITTLQTFLAQQMPRWVGDQRDSLLPPLQQELRERYKIVSQMVASRGSIGRASTLSVSSGTAEYSLDLETRDGDFNLGAAALGVGAGALIGTLIAPGIGTVIGGAIGALLGFFESLDSVKEKNIAAVQEAARTLEASVVQQLDGRREALVADLTRQLEQQISQNIREFQHWIDQLLRAEQQRIDSARRQLKALEDLRTRCAAHLKRLEDARSRAAQESRALCA